MTKGIRVAKDGRDASRGLGRDLAFTSEDQSLKIHDDQRDPVRSIIVAGAPTNVTVTINHNFFYVPVVRFFGEAVLNSNKWFGDTNLLDLISDLEPLTVAWKIMDVNEKTIVFFVVLPANVSVFRFKYWIFEDSLDV
jgi:hypothetical protein